VPTPTKAARRSKQAARGAQHQARRAKGQPTVARIARASLGARAAVYVLLAAITAELAAGVGGGEKDTGVGAVQALARQPGGPFLVVILAVAMTAYAAWRFLQAVAGDDGVPSGRETAKRVGWAGIGLAYVALAARSVLVLFGHHPSRRGASSLSKAMLGMAGGRVVLVAIGLAVAAGGLSLAVWAALQRFETYMPDRRTPDWANVAERVSATFGNVCRGLVFAAVGASFIVSGALGTAKDAKDTDQLLRSLIKTSFGRPVLGVVALGFLAFAGSTVLEALYRKI